MRVFRYLEWLRKHCSVLYPVACGLLAEYAIVTNSHRIADQIIMSRDEGAN